MHINVRFRTGELVLAGLKLNKAGGEKDGVKIKLCISNTVEDEFSSC